MFVILKDGREGIFSLKKYHQHQHKKEHWKTKGIFFFAMIHVNEKKWHKRYKDYSKKTLSLKISHIHIIQGHEYHSRELRYCAITIGSHIQF